MIQKSNLAQAFGLCQCLFSPFRAVKSQPVAVIAVTFSSGGFSQPRAAGEQVHGWSSAASTQPSPSCNCENPQSCCSGHSLTAFTICDLPFCSLNYKSETQRAYT